MVRNSFELKAEKALKRGKAARLIWRNVSLFVRPGRTYTYGMKIEHLDAPKTEAIRLGSGLTIYKQPKRPGRGSPYWYARAIVDVGGRKLHTRSTRTTDIREATQRAEDFKADLEVQRRQGTAIPGALFDRCYRFDKVAEGMLDRLERGLGSDPRSARRYKDHRKILHAPNGPIAFFGGNDIRSFKQSDLEDYLAFAEELCRHGELKPATKRNLLSTMSAVFTFAIGERLIDRKPTFPKISMKDHPRASFSRSEVDQLLRECREKASQMSGPERDEWLELGDFIEFMVGTFLRPSEWPGLLHRHVKIVDAEGLVYLEMLVHRGKTGRRVSVSMPEAVHAYRRMVERNGNDPNRCVILPDFANRVTAQAVMRKRLRRLLGDCGLTLNASGEKRTSYSLRHTALTLRILEGDKIDLLTLAKNAGTSVRMLDRFYCSGLDPRMKVADIQSTKRKVAAPTKPHIVIPEGWSDKMAQSGQKVKFVQIVHTG